MGGPARLAFALYRIASLCYLFQGKDALAFQVASRWAAAGGDPAQSNLLAATAAVLGDDLADATACLDRVSTSGPAAARADLVRAVLKLRQGDQAGCRDALDRGFPKHPADEANRCALAMHLTFATDERVRDPRRALDIAKAGVAAGSALEPVRAVCLANAYADTGEFGKAIEVLYEPAGLDERQRKAVREAFERRQPLRHDHNASKWMQRQLLLHSQIDGR
jgi:hypothetical protein